MTTTPEPTAAGGMRLAIADPPYLGVAERFYGPGANGQTLVRGPKRAARGHAPSIIRTTEHPDAKDWDNPDRHRQLVNDIQRGYDGWAIALSRRSIPLYLDAAPPEPETHLCIWVKPTAFPGGNSRFIGAYEAVLVRPARRASPAPGLMVRDTLTATVERVGHIGAKPAAWTRWVLALMGYEPGDIVVDLFPGSGAVTATTAQGALL